MQLCHGLVLVIVIATSCERACGLLVRESVFKFYTYVLSLHSYCADMIVQAHDLAVSILHLFLRLKEFLSTPPCLHEAFLSLAI